MENLPQSNSTQLIHCKSYNNFFSQPPVYSTIDHTPRSSARGDRTVRHTDRSIVPQSTFNFESTASIQGLHQTVDRIHTRMITKQTDGKVLLCAKHPTSSKQNWLSNTKNKNSKAKPQRKTGNKNSEYINPSGMISIKSYQPDGKLSSSKQNTKSHSRNHSGPLGHQLKGEKEVYELFRQVRRKLDGSTDMNRKIKKKQKCFFTSLKQKLQIEIKYVAEQKERDRLTLMIEGCHAVQHCKLDQRSYLYGVSSLPKQNRPKTAGHKKSLTEQKEKIWGKRPQSSHPRATYTGQSPQEANSWSRKELQLKKDSNIAPSKVSKMRPVSSCKLRNTQIKDSSIQDPRKSVAQISSKLSNIISLCDEERTDKNVNNNMKTFEFYCKKLQEGFDRATKKIEVAEFMNVE